MSLTRQLWLAVIVVMTLAFGGTFIISTTAARDYLAHQLNVKNIDNVTALALTMTQMDKDPVTIELMLSAQFDAGHYRLIRLTDPEGALLFERQNDTPVQGAPTAFVSAMHLDTAPGTAHVQDGWKQYGVLTLESHDQFAYIDLWNGSVRLLGWFSVAALLVGALGSLLLRVILRPLQGVVAQAEAMGERRFVTHAELVTLEFKQWVRAMNSLSERVQTMLARGTKQLEELRQKIQIDPITGLSNRETFISTLEDALGQDDVSASGIIVILRVSGLAELNRMIGRESVDELLRMHAFINLNRICERDTVFHGVAFRAGDNIVVPSFVTDRDERVFADPDAFNADRSKREKNQHHAFGAGAHKCIGLHVAKMEVRVVMEALFDRIGSLELVSESAVTGHGGTTMGLDAIPIKVTLD